MEALTKIIHPRAGEGWREGWAERGEGNGMVTIVDPKTENVLFYGGDTLFLEEIRKGRIECDEESLDAFYCHGEEWPV